MNAAPTNYEQFVDDYITAWSTQDNNLRKELIAKLYASNADFYATEPGDGPVERHGLAELMDNITQVNVRFVQDKGLITESTGFAVNHDVIKVSWKMSAPDGTVAMTGMNLLTRNSDSMIIRDYIFIG